MKFVRGNPVHVPVLVSMSVLEYDCGKMSLPGTGCETRCSIVPDPTADGFAFQPSRKRPDGIELSFTSVKSEVDELTSHCAPLTVGAVSRLKLPWQLEV